MKIDKKYYSILEVSRFLKIPQHRLRYLEKSAASKLIINKVKNRRYYTKEDINLLSRLINKNITDYPLLNQNDVFLTNINNLITKFTNLANLLLIMTQKQT